MIIDFVLSKQKIQSRGGECRGGVKRGLNSINTSDVDMDDEYEGRGMFDSEPTKILLSEKYVLLTFRMRQLVVVVIVF